MSTMEDDIKNIDNKLLCLITLGTCPRFACEGIFNELPLSILLDCVEKTCLTQAYAKKIYSLLGEIIESDQTRARECEERKSRSDSMVGYELLPRKKLCIGADIGT